MAQGLQFFTPFKRAFKGSLDVDSVFETLQEMQDFLEDETRYAGQIAVCKEEEGKLYVLNNAETEWLLLEGGGDKHKQYYVEHTTEQVITHDLGKKPSVQIIQDGGNQCIASVQHLNENQVEIKFENYFTGTITFN